MKVVHINLQSEYLYHFSKEDIELTHNTLIVGNIYNVIDLNGEGYKLENGYWYYNNFFITLDEYRDTRIEYLIKK